MLNRREASKKQERRRKQERQRGKPLVMHHDAQMYVLPKLKEIEKVLGDLCNQLALVQVLGLGNLGPMGIGNVVLQNLDTLRSCLATF